MLQLNPTIPLDTPKGPGHAHFLIDMGQEHHLLWVVFLDESGECWTFRNPEVRLQANPTMGVRNMAKKKHHHTGKAVHGDMNMHDGSRGMGGKDPHAHPSHHENNKKHGTPAGMSPMDDSDESGGEGGNAIPETEGNSEDYDG